MGESQGRVQGILERWWSEEAQQEAGAGGRGPGLGTGVPGSKVKVQSEVQRDHVGVSCLVH